jgi:acyl dehydratase
MADKTKLGMEFPPYTYVVEKGKIAEFAMAVAQKDSKTDVNPVYVDPEAAKKEGYRDVIVTPTMQTCFSMWSGGGLGGLIEVLGIDIARLLHGEEEYEYYGEINPGDVMTGKTKVVQMYDKEKKNQPGKYMEFTVMETEIRNQRGELVLKSRTTTVER